MASVNSVDRKSSFLPIAVSTAAAVALLGGATLWAVRRQRAANYSSPDWWRAKFANVKFNQSFFDKLKNFRNDGRSSLACIFDFDHSIGGLKSSEGRICKTSYGVISSSPLVSQHHRDATAELKVKYHPLERDMKRSKEERHAAMDAWWDGVHKLMDRELTKSLVYRSIELAIQNGDLFLRHGATELLESLAKGNVPTLVMSAGLYQTVEHTLALHGLLTSNVDVCANQPIFDESGDDAKIVRWTRSRSIHSGNKSFAVVEKDAKFRQHAIVQSNRANVLLLGDSLNDVEMAKGLVCKEVLSIGLLNDPSKGDADQFPKLFDAVIEGDGSLDLVTAVIDSFKY